MGRLNFIENSVFALMVFSILLWVLVFLIISGFGWSALAARYKLNKEFEGERIGVVSAAVNLMKYNQTLVLHYDEGGMLLKPFFLLRVAHSPVFIPWSEIKEVHDTEKTLVKYKELVIGEPMLASIKLKSELYDQIRMHYELHKTERL